MRFMVTMPWERDLSVNASHFGAGGGFRRKPDVQAWQRTLAWLVSIRPTARDKAEMRLPLYVTVDFRYPDKRRRDPDNYSKCVLDAVAEGLDVDDQHFRFVVGSVTVDKANAGFTIRVTDDD